MWYKKLSTPLSVNCSLNLAIMSVTILTLMSPTAYTAEIDLPEELQALLVEKPAIVDDFNLVDQYKKPFTRDRLKNKWTFVFFGYTNCPDVCPTTMAEIDNAAARLKKLNDSRNDIQYVFVSIDPGRDTPEHLAEYVSYFTTPFIATTGEESELKKFATPLRVGFRVGFKTESTYFMDHGASMILIDPEARYYARFRPPHYSEEIVSRFKSIMDYRSQIKNASVQNK